MSLKWMLEVEAGCTCKLRQKLRVNFVSSVTVLNEMK